mmetsp:Transcript_12108/g.17857  ORF Transcript_12108/g.17857 Transcript_12108/m.17857 type:complete len:278 (-) Transcript_12108:241-1074(-)|eukprot:CAMPEP_0113942498 /NCGR_PEP_ID=MMETSP1339-20121228/8206_1 /TAXON_ID=94617 /ORGANISM="Fibrocapsa japonica" /LENGTH=277 /DNA_ID=CAMNT_0000947001 /DNA_START=150 /DNA_END=983 /DNA_ORIENTATION=+ /assembly_acc=CAM_ASM_000762
MDARPTTAPINSNFEQKASNFRPGTSAPATRRRNVKDGQKFSSTSDLLAMSSIENVYGESSLRPCDSRFGKTKGKNTFIPNEQRFAWQIPQVQNDMFYELGDTLKRTAPRFGTSTREDWAAASKNTKDGLNPYTGPGCYRVGNERSILSTSPGIKANRFGMSNREFVAMKTASPGPSYNVQGIHRNGTSNRRILPAFNKDNRKPLAENLGSITDSMYYPKPIKGGPVTKFGKDEGFRERHYKSGNNRSPGPIYDTSNYNFKTGPSFSFGSSKTKRFG